MEHPSGRTVAVDHQDYEVKEFVDPNHVDARSFINTEDHS